MKGDFSDIGSEDESIMVGLFSSLLEMAYLGQKRTFANAGPYARKVGLQWSYLRSTLKTKSLLTALIFKEPTVSPKALSNRSSPTSIELLLCFYEECSPFENAAAFSSPSEPT